MDLNETLRWLLGRGVGLLIGTVVLLVIYRVGLTAIHRLVPTVINAQAAHLPSGSSSAEEVGKRIGTIEDLLRKLLRLGVLAGFVVVALAVFELWAVIGGDRPRRRRCRVRHQGCRPGLRDGVPDPRRRSVLQGRLRERRRARRDRGGRRGDRSAPDGVARCDGRLERRLEWAHPAVDEPHPAVLRRGRRPPRPPRRPAGRRSGDDEPGRGRDTRGRSMGRQVPGGCADQRLGHRDRHGRRLGQAPAAGPRRRPRRRRQRASSAAGRGAGVGVDRDRTMGYADAHREQTFTAPSAS